MKSKIDNNDQDFELAINFLVEKQEELINYIFPKLINGELLSTLIKATESRSQAMENLKIELCQDNLSQKAKKEIQEEIETLTFFRDFFDFDPATYEELYQTISEAKKRIDIKQKNNLD